jgi:putative endonuclease
MATDSSAADTGLWGEDTAAAVLKKKGYRILGKRVHVDARSEIDVIAKDCKVLVFVEVKTRRNERFGRPSAAVDRRKRHMLSRAAVRYIKKKRFPEISFRFDIVEVIGHPDIPDPLVRHIENAFELDSQYRLP